MTEGLTFDLVGDRRFNRKSVLTILDGTVAIKTIHGYDQDSTPFGLRMSFQVERKLTPVFDSARIRIWNLNAESRGMLAQRVLIRAPRDPLRYVLLEAGYKDRLGVIFSGAINKAENIREGPDWVTELECLAFYGQARINTLGKSWGAPIPVESIIRELFDAAGWKDVNILPKALEKIAGKKTNTKVVIGSAYLAVRRLLDNYGLTFSVDVNGPTVYKPLHPDETSTPDVPFLQLDENLGLVGTPKITAVGATFKAFLDPRIRPGLIVKIDSPTLRKSLTDPSLGWEFSLVEVVCNGDTHTDDWFSEVNNAVFFPPEDQNSLGNVLGPKLKLSS